MMDFCVLGSGVAGSTIANLLSKKYSVHIFDKARGPGGRASNKRFKNNLSFDILTNSSYLVTGNSGSGKSTLLRLLAGIYIPTSGEAKIPKYALPLLDKSIMRELDDEYDAA